MLSQQSKELLTRSFLDGKNDEKLEDKQMRLKNIQHLLETNPNLAQQFNEVVAQGKLKTITLDAEAGTAGSYNAEKQCIRLEKSTIQYMYSDNPVNPNEPLKAEIANDFAFTLGHELKHAQNAQRNTKNELKAMGVDAFEKEIDQIAQSSKPGARDYTAAIANRIKAERMDEASAQITGWNTLMAAKKQENPNITPLQVAQGLGLKQGQIGSYFFDQQGKPVPGLSFNADGTITDNAANREAQGKAYYDQPASRMQLGATKTDYRNAGADEWVSKIIAAEEKYADKHAAGSYAQIDMNALGLRQADIQAQGVAINSSRTGASAKIVDSSDAQHPKTMHFYNDKAVPEGYPTTTPGLPKDAPQQGALNQSQQAANDSQTRSVDHAAMWRDSLVVGQQYAQAQQLQNPTVGARV